MIPEPIWDVFWEACIARGGPFAWCFVCPWVRKIVLLMPGTPQVHQKRQNMKKKIHPICSLLAAFYSFLAQRTLLVLASVDPVIKVRADRRSPRLLPLCLQGQNWTKPPMSLSKTNRNVPRHDKPSAPGEGPGGGPVRVRDADVPV